VGTRPNHTRGPGASRTARSCGQYGATATRQYCSSASATRGSPSAKVDEPARGGRQGDPRRASADVVEVSPPFDHAEITALAVATVVCDVLALIARSGRPTPGAPHERHRLARADQQSRTPVYAPSGGIRPVTIAPHSCQLQRHDGCRRWT
jgi:Arginase family